LLINRLFIQQKLTHKAIYLRGHGAEPDSNVLGFGMVYYGLVHALRAQACCVLGSGGGFVPRIVRQAQLDMCLPRSETYLVDADCGNWGRPDWTDPNSFFRKNWPDIMWINAKTEDAVHAFSDQCIEFLHIDADHSRAMEDFTLWARKVKPGGAVTIHDTKTRGGCNAGKAVGFIRDLPGWDVVDFDIGVGVGIAYRRPN
jgi:hypothetical protein